MAGYNEDWKLFEVGCKGWWRFPGAAGQGLAASTHPTTPARSKTTREQDSQGALGKPQPQASGTCLGMGTGQGRVRTWACSLGSHSTSMEDKVCMGIAAQHLQQNSGGGQTGEPQLKTRSQAKVVSKCTWILQPYQYFIFLEQMWGLWLLYGILFIFSTCGFSMLK